MTIELADSGDEVITSMSDEIFRDARRYRWRRSLAGKSLLELAEIFGLEDGPTTPEKFDAITDAAMKKSVDNKGE